MLRLAVRQSGLPLKVFDSSTGFLLRDGSVRSPDAGPLFSGLAIDLKEIGVA